MTTLYLRDRWFEDLPVGEFHVFGSHTFSELKLSTLLSSLILDPNQPTPKKRAIAIGKGLSLPVAGDSYVDAENGRLYGGLCARR